MKNKKKGNFTIKKSIQKYKNPWIEVVEDQVIRPDGKNGIFGIIKMSGGIAVLPIDNDNNVYLTKEFHYAINESDVETVGGGKENNEIYLKAAKRELEEELGIKAKKWIDLGLVNPLTTLLECPQKLFLAKDLAFGKNNPEETENIKLVKIKLEKAVEMVMNSKITHGPSCVLILKTEKYLNNHNGHKS